MNEVAEQVKALSNAVAHMLMTTEDAENRALYQGMSEAYANVIRMLEAASA